jgi:DNA invertase Pin-like site-specific DNA recombinase
MAQGKWISYLRVSTDRQGQSGLGIEAQRKAVADYLNGGCWQLLHEYVEVESGKRNDRPQLVAALAHAKATGATILIAKLDRLSRNAHFLLGLKEAGVDFQAVDMPGANRLTVGIMALVAEEERRMISARTKAALAAAKARGQKLGNPNGAAVLRGRGNAEAVTALKLKADVHAAQVRPIIEAIRGEGKISLNTIAGELNNRGILTANGGRWHAMTVRNLLQREAAR